MINDTKYSGLLENVKNGKMTKFEVLVEMSTYATEYLKKIAEWSGMNYTDACDFVWEIINHGRTLQVLDEIDFDTQVSD